jgi:DedD protein
MAQDNLQSQAEQEIQFKKRARRRLVGAVALVLLMIVILPVLLEDKLAQTPKEDVVIFIPSQDNQSQTKPEESSVSQDQPENASAFPSSAVNAPVGDSSLTDNQVPASNVSSNPAPANQAKPIEPQAAVVENNSVATPPEVKASTKEEPMPKKVQADVNAEDIFSAASIYLQIGVFSDPENVKKMQVQLSDKGLKSKSELIDTSKGKKTRLRVGPFTTQKEADLALAKLKSLKLAAILVNN